MSCATLTLTTRSPAETRTLGARLGSLLRAGTVVALYGELGAGKTTFTQGLACGLDVTARVTSPTFTLVADYAARDDTRLVHMDSYRLGDAPDDAALEAATFGIDELLDDARAVVVIEWADRLAQLLPAGTLYITMEIGEEGTEARTLRLHAQASPGCDLIAALASST